MRNCVFTLGAVAALAAVGCDAAMPGAPDGNDELAGTIPGLSGPQVAMHATGDAEFARVLSASAGLGPVFVAASCESCHVGDGKGHPVFNITRFGRAEAAGFDGMRASCSASRIPTTSMAMASRAACSSSMRLTSSPRSLPLRAWRPTGHRRAAR